jgi:hypothetical protein
MLGSAPSPLISIWDAIHMIYIMQFCISTEFSPKQQQVLLKL